MVPRFRLNPIATPSSSDKLPTAKIDERREKMSSQIDSRVALVTGAAMGIGAAIAEQLARDGLTVLVSDLNLEEAEKTARSFRDSGLSAQPLHLDVRLPASVNAAFDQ